MSFCNLCFCTWAQKHGTAGGQTRWTSPAGWSSASGPRSARYKIRLLHWPLILLKNHQSSCYFRFTPGDAHHLLTHRGQNCIAGEHQNLLKKVWTKLIVPSEIFMATGEDQTKKITSSWTHRSQGDFLVTLAVLWMNCPSCIPKTWANLWVHIIHRIILTIQRGDWTNSSNI